jgi:excisionase family DNA binding protein
MSDLITTTKAAEILGVHPSTVNALCKRGALRAEKPLGQWLIDEEFLREFALTYDTSRRPKTPNTTAINKPVGKGWKTKYQSKRPQWDNVQQQKDAVMAGKVRPVWMTAVGEVIK